MKLVASMIVRNELDRYLQPCIEHLLTFCDEIAIVDDGGSDGTHGWAGHIDRVHCCKTGSSHFFEHEGKARQFLLDWTFTLKPDYVLSIDADEFVGQPNAVRDACNQGGPVYTLQMEEVWRADNHLHIRVDHAWRPRPCPILWRAPSDPRADLWKIPDVQLACGREPLAVRRMRAAVSGASVYHFGWACESDRPGRAQRYFEHDQGRFHKDAHLQSILWPDEQVGTEQKQWPAGLANVRDRLVERASRKVAA